MYNPLDVVNKVTLFFHPSSNSFCSEKPTLTSKYDQTILSPSSDSPKHESCMPATGQCEKTTGFGSSFSFVLTSSA